MLNFSCHLHRERYLSLKFLDQSNNNINKKIAGEINLYMCFLSVITHGDIKAAQFRITNYKCCFGEDIIFSLGRPKGIMDRTKTG